MDFNVFKAEICVGATFAGGLTYQFVAWLGGAHTPITADTPEKLACAFFGEAERLHHNNDSITIAYKTAQSLWSFKKGQNIRLCKVVPLSEAELREFHAELSNQYTRELRYSTHGRPC